MVRPVGVACGTVWLQIAWLVAVKLPTAVTSPAAQSDQPSIPEAGTGDEDGTEDGKEHKGGPQGGLADSQEAED
jgi:hypothetical protein